MKLSQIIFSIIFVLIFSSSTVVAKSGVESIIESDIKTPDSYDEFDDGMYQAGSFDSGSGGYTYDANESDSWIQLNLSFENMTAAVEDSLGVPESNYIILILFSLAALLQMARVITGGGDWVSFTVRIIVCLSFLRCYTLLFDGLQVFFSYLADNILSGQSAFESFWSHWRSIWNVVMGVVNNNGAALDFIKNGLFLVITGITAVLAFAFYILIFLAQSCIIITLKYLGPIVISLAVIPETDYSSGFTTTTIQTFAWSVVMAILIKIMGTMMVVGSVLQLNEKDFVIISAMNCCFALAFIMIPVMTGMIFSGKGVGGAGSALASLAGGMVYQGIKNQYEKYFGNNKNDFSSTTSRNENSHEPRGLMDRAGVGSSSGAAATASSTSPSKEQKQTNTEKASYSVAHINTPLPTHKAEFVGNPEKRT